MRENVGGRDRPIMISIFWGTKWCAYKFLVSHINNWTAEPTKLHETQTNATIDFFCFSLRLFSTMSLCCLLFVVARTIAIASYTGFFVEWMLLVYTFQVIEWFRHFTWMSELKRRKETWKLKFLSKWNQKKMFRQKRNSVRGVHTLWYWERLSVCSMDISGE